MIKHRARQREAGRAWLLTVGLVLALAAIAGAGWFVYQGRQGDDNAGSATGGRWVSPDQRVEELQEQFKTYTENNLDFYDLLPEVRRFAEDYPDRVDAHILLGQVLMKLERWDEALVPLERALSIQPRNFQLQKLAGSCAAKLGRWNEAELHLNEALSLKSERDVLLMLGNVYLKTSRIQLAEEHYLRAIDAPTKAGEGPPHLAYSGLADVYSEQGELQQAVHYVDLAITWGAADRNVQEATYRLQKVRLLLDAGRSEDASALLISVLDSYPEASDTLAYAKLQARVWAERDLYAAIPGLFEGIYARTISQPDADPAVLGEALAELAHWRLQMGQTEQAAKAISRLRVTRPNHPRLDELQSRLSQVQ